METKSTKGTAGQGEGTMRRLPVAYGIKDAVEAIGLGRSTLYEMMQKGTLRFVKIGRRRLIPADALMALIEPELRAA
ncbi:helix-turn-helix domain-containing protein [Rhodoblastus sp.]|uniref:helix-turn-helix domain-containing protein n=1 Tax=Rhodoblastus sp. TaxID=1962975 RepID=UPI0035B0061C